MVSVFFTLLVFSVEDLYFYGNNVRNFLHFLAIVYAVGIMH